MLGGLVRILINFKKFREFYFFCNTALAIKSRDLLSYELCFYKVSNQDKEQNELRLKSDILDFSSFFLVY